MRILLPLILVALLIAPLTPVGAQSSQEAAVYQITINYTFSNPSSYTASNVVATIYLFDNWSGWTDQQVLSEQIELNGSIITPETHDEEDNRWIEVDLGTLGPHQSKTVTVTQVVKVQTVELDINPASVGTEIPEPLLKYTQPVPNLFESDDPGIQSLVSDLTAGMTNPYEKARRIFDWIVDNITYVHQTSEHGALYCFQTRVGDCTEFSNLFVAMARAAGIPAKVVSGSGFLPLYSISGESVNFDDIGHAWAIFYLPGYGWVPVDGTWPQGEGSFARLSYEHITGATTGGEGVVQGGSIKWPGPGQANVRWTYTVGKYASVTISTSGTATPLVLLDVSGTASNQIQKNGSLNFTITVKNRGSASASNLRAELEYDPADFEPVQASAQLGSLESGKEWQPVLTLRVGDNAYNENHTLKIRVTYSSDYELAPGNYTASSEIRLNIPPKPAAVIVEDYLILILVALLVIAVVAVAGALARR